MGGKRSKKSRKPKGTGKAPQHAAASENPDKSIPHPPAEPEEPVEAAKPQVAEKPGQASQPVPLQKRQIGATNGGRAKPGPKRARVTPLTTDNLALLNLIARGLASEPESESEGYPPTLSSEGLVRQFHENGILDPLNSQPPANFEAIRNRYARPLTSGLPSVADYRRYAKTMSRAHSNASIYIESIGWLFNRYDEDEWYCRAFGQEFSGIPKRSGFNDNVCPPESDYVEGLTLEAFEPFPVEQHIKGAALYEDHPYSLVAPNLIGEWMGSRDEIEDAVLHVGFDGAALVYSRMQVLAYLGAPDPPGHAVVASFATDGADMHIYANYATPGEGSKLKYHHYPIVKIDLLESYENFKLGYQYVRNAQDLAREHSYALRDRLMQHWYSKQEQQRGKSQTVNRSRKADMPPPGGSTAINS